MPPVVWAFAGAAGVVLLGLSALTGYLVLRRRVRSTIESLAPKWIAATLVVATIPWLIVWLAPINIELNVHTIPVLIGWVLLALCAFALLVLVPLAAILTAGVWGLAWRRQRERRGLS